MGSASPFNIISEALTLANFTSREIASLYGQHTEATGQLFEDGALRSAWHWTEGQPWLVNALAREVVYKRLKMDFSVPITSEHIDKAAETIILRRDTHIDSLLFRLQDPRVSRVMAPILMGQKPDPSLVSANDLQYVLDLGLLTKESTGYRISNAIYREAIPRSLSEYFGAFLPDNLSNRWMDGFVLDMSSLVKEFQIFWREFIGNNKNFEDFKECWPHIAFMGFLQRVANGGAALSREYPLGSRRVDILVKYQGNPYPVELKIKDNQTKKKSIEQILKYMDLCGAKEGWLIIFDNDFSKNWSDKLTWEITEHPKDYKVHVVGL
jgi:hypothetical protein